MYPDLDGKCVVVTGASRGIGEALARGFLAEGCRVVAMARGPIGWAAGEKNLVTLRGDIQDPKPLADWMAKEGTRIHVLMNNAGALTKGPLLDVTPADFDLAFGVNARATFFLSQLVARHMKAKGGGVMVNTASYAVERASVSHAIYAASKAALVALTRGMAAEWAPFGIRVNAFSPGVIPTAMTEPAVKQNEAKMLEMISLRRLGTVSEVAQVALFLASDASSYLTGVNIDVSGGKLIVQDPGSAWK